MIKFSHPRCFGFAKLTVVCSHFRGCASPESGGTRGLVPTAFPTPPPMAVGFPGWRRCSWSGHSVRRLSGSSVWKKRKGGPGAPTLKEVVSVSPDPVSQDPKLLSFYLFLSAHPWTSPDTPTPQSWSAPFPCLALQCYLLPSASEAQSTKCISEMCWRLIRGSACNMGGLGRGS